MESSFWCKNNELMGVSDVGEEDIIFNHVNALCSVSKVYRCKRCGRWKHFVGYMDLIFPYRPSFLLILNVNSK